MFENVFSQTKCVNMQRKCVCVKWKRGGGERWEGEEGEEGEKGGGGEGTCMHPHSRTFITQGYRWSRGQEAWTTFRRVVGSIPGIESTPRRHSRQWVVTLTGYM
jgi:hypothetical protein